MYLIQSVIKHIRETSIFVLAVSLAAVAHSSWTFSTILGGDEPTALGERIPWILIGLCLAFSLDIGLLALSGEIRHGKRSAGRFVAFVVLAAAMAYLQTVFCLTHAPVLTLSRAVRADWINGAQMILDLAVFVIPTLLPVSLILHTFSGEKAAQTESATPSNALAVIPQPDAERREDEITIEKPVEIECQDCDWSGSYTSAIGARNALAAHRQKHKVDQVASSNGRH